MEYTEGFNPIPFTSVSELTGNGVEYLLQLDGTLIKFYNGNMQSSELPRGNANDLTIAA